MALVDAFAGLLLRAGLVAVALGPVALVVSARWLLRLRGRGKLFWVTGAALSSIVLFVAAGLSQPRILIGPLAIPVVGAVTLASILVLPVLAALLLGRRPERKLEALYVLCTHGCAVSAAALVVQASASV